MSGGQYVPLQQFDGDEREELVVGDLDATAVDARRVVEVD